MKFQKNMIIIKIKPEFNVKNIVKKIAVINHYFVLGLVKNQELYIIR